MNKTSKALNPQQSITQASFPAGVQAIAGTSYEMTVDGIRESCTTRTLLSHWLLSWSETPVPVEPEGTHWDWKVFFTLDNDAPDFHTLRWALACCKRLVSCASSLRPIDEEPPVTLLTLQEIIEAPPSDQQVELIQKHISRLRTEFLEKEDALAWAQANAGTANTERRAEFHEATLKFADECRQASVAVDAPTSEDICLQYGAMRASAEVFGCTADNEFLAAVRLKGSTTLVENPAMPKATKKTAEREETREGSSTAKGAKKAASSKAVIATRLAPKR